jgi:hypothetical protein
LSRQAAAKRGPVGVTRHLHRKRTADCGLHLCSLSDRAWGRLNPPYELRALMRGIQYVRNTVIHAIVEPAHDTEHNFRLHSKNRDLSKQQIFSVENLTNYAAHVVTALRFSLGFRDGSTFPYTLPDRPEIPEFLRSVTQWPKD